MSTSKLLVPSILFLLTIPACKSPASINPDVDDGDAPEEDAFRSLSAKIDSEQCWELNQPNEDGTCPAYQQAELHRLCRIGPDENNVIRTGMVVRERDRCVPDWVCDTSYNSPEVDCATACDINKCGGKWEVTKIKARTYGFPKNHANAASINWDDPDDPNIGWSAPGPTFIAHVGSEPGATDGTRFQMRLHNRMNTETTGNKVCNTYDKQPSTTAVWPNCFHGDNATNFHFHGFHISPQAPQDYVGVAILPAGTTKIGEHDAAHGDAVIGEYDYNVAPLPWDQAPGTHWYHAHKHGATALQLLNGLSGAFYVRGPFDKWLAEYYEDQGGLEERLMVVQQIAQDLPFTGNNPAPGAQLVNGQANPIVYMKPGEVQRWRLVGATMQVAAQVNVRFESSNPKHPEPIWMEIARDGVQFAPENYARQPFAKTTALDGASDTDPWFSLDPGNRIDLLVQAPTTPGTHYFTFDRAGTLGDKAGPIVEAREAGIIKALIDTDDSTDLPTSPPLFTVIVRDESPKDMHLPKCTIEDGKPIDETCPASEWPRMPTFLTDIPETTKEKTKVVYQMVGATKPNEVTFWINDRQYCSDCANNSLALDEPEQWVLENDSTIAHPFHIHTNPFQLIELNDVSSGEVTKFEAPYPWADTIAIPVAKFDDDGALVENGSATINQLAHDYTGAFVQHCHILGHEDRGMMHNVQTVCPADGPNGGNYGKARYDGGPECVADNPPEQAVLSCDETNPETGAPFCPEGILPDPKN